MKTDFAQLKRLGIFASVVQHGSFAAAARTLSMSRSAVSEQVALLEAALGVRLLQRTTRLLALTREGEQIYPLAAQITGALTGITEIIEQETLRGRLRITATQDVAVQWLNQRLLMFQQQYPEIYFDLILADTLLNLVSEQIDLAIRVGRQFDEGLIARPLFQQAPQIIASPAYLSAYGEPDELDTLQQHTWILLAQLNTEQRVTLFNNSRQISFTPERYHRCDSPLIMRHLVEQDMGIGLHLPLMAEAQINQQQLQIIMPDWQGPVLTFSLVYPSRRHLPLRTRCLIDFLLSEFRNSHHLPA